MSERIYKSKDKFAIEVYTEGLEGPEMCDIYRLDVDRTKPDMSFEKGQFKESVIFLNRISELLGTGQIGNMPKKKK